jgi:hypothetical protein
LRVVGAEFSDHCTSSPPESATGCKNFQPSINTERILFRALGSIGQIETLLGVVLHIFSASAFIATLPCAWANLIDWARFGQISRGFDRYRPSRSASCGKPSPFQKVSPSASAHRVHHRKKSNTRAYSLSTSRPQCWRQSRVPSRSLGVVRSENSSSVVAVTAVASPD